MSYVQLYAEFLYFFCSFLNFRFKEYKNWIPAESIIHFHTCKRSHGIKTNKSNWQMLRKTLSEITFHVKWGDNKCSLMAVSKIISKWYIIWNILKFLFRLQNSFVKIISNFLNDSRVELWYCEILQNIFFFYISNVRRMQECFCYVKDIML